MFSCTLGRLAHMRRTSASVPAGCSALHAGSATPPHAAGCLTPPRHWCQPPSPHVVSPHQASGLPRTPSAVSPCRKGLCYDIMHVPASSSCEAVLYLQSSGHSTESGLAFFCTAPRPSLQSLHAVPGWVPGVASSRGPLCRDHAAGSPATSVLQASHMSSLQVDKVSRMASTRAQRSHQAHGVAK